MMNTALEVLADTNDIDWDRLLPDHPVGPDLVDQLPDPDLDLELDLVSSSDAAVWGLGVLNRVIADQDEHLANYQPRPEWRELIAT